MGFYWPAKPILTSAFGFCQCYFTGQCKLIFTSTKACNCILSHISTWNTEISKWNKIRYFTQWNKNVNHEYHLACDNGKTSPLLKPFIPAYNVKNLGNNNYTCISNIKHKLLVTEQQWQFTHVLMPEIRVGFSFGESRSIFFKILKPTI
jgi:hypothetical protein